MEFVYRGTLDELKQSIKVKACALHKDIMICQDEATVLQVGFLRLGYSSGRFFVADIAEEKGSIILNGEIKNLDSKIASKDERSFLQKAWDTLLGLAFFYVLLAFIPWVLWAGLDLPHPWIAFAIPAAIIAAIEIAFLLSNALCKKKRTFEAEDSSFLEFMTMVCSNEILFPTNSQELYQMLLNTQGLHSFPQIKDDIITWDLYDKVSIEASITKSDTIIDVIQPNMLHGSYMHWHPDLEEIYDELVALGKKGNVLVLKKTLAGTMTYYIGPAEEYPFSPKKKWHWGRLIYLKQT